MAHPSSIGPDGLTDRMRRFVVEYRRDLLPTKAAERAGVPPKKAAEVGRKYMAHPRVLKAIDEGMELAVEKTHVTEEWITDVVIETINRCRQAAPVLDRKGDPVMVETPNGQIAPAYKFDARGVFEGLRLLGRGLGMFTEDVNDKLDITVRIKKFSDDNEALPPPKDITSPPQIIEHKEGPS